MLFMVSERRTDYGLYTIWRICPNSQNQTSPSDPGSIVSVSTHGCIQDKKQKLMFKIGLEAMLEALSPSAVLVHGYMPEEIFGEYIGQVDFHRYASEFERTHRKEGA